MAVKVIKYPLDRTGKSPDNLVLQEPHIVPRDKARTFTTYYGPFFTESLVVRQKGNSTPLKIGTDYKPIQLYQDATAALGMSVSSAIILTNASLGSNIEIDYQVVGGPFSLSTDAIQDNIDNLELDTRKVAWIDVLGKPVRFPPAPHLHDADDLFGMEYVYAALEDIRIAILQGDVASHEQIYNYIDRLRDLIYIDIDKLADRIGNVSQDLDALRQELQNAINGAVAALAKQLTDHINDKNNPHAVTKTQVGLNNVQNYSMTTNAQALEEDNTTSYVSPSAMWYAIKQKVLSVINAHIADKNNPHGVNKTQVGLSDVPNFPMATLTDAQAGTAYDRFMSPGRTMELLSAKIWPTINAHLGDKNNPHGVTTTQIGAVPITRRINGQALTQDIVVGSVLPAMVVIWPSPWIPPGWYACNGQAVGNDPKLRAVVGNNVPDYRGLFLRMVDMGRGVDPDSGRGVGSWQGHMMVDHAHISGVETSYSDVPGSNTRNVPGGAEMRWYSNRTGAVAQGILGATTGPEVRPVNLGVMYIIAGDNAATIF